MELVTMCLSRQGAWTDTQSGVPEPPRAHDLQWPQVKLRNWPTEVLKYLPICFEPAQWENHSDFEIMFIYFIQHLSKKNISTENSFLTSADL